MRVSFRELMDKLGVGHVLHAYETQPWLHYDSDEGITASAEVRLNGDGDEVEAEIQFMYDTPPPGKPPVEQIAWMRIRPVIREKGLFCTTDLWIRRENWASKVYDWEIKSCNFFRACVREIKTERLPDIDMILSRELGSREVWGGAAGEGSNKSPKIKTNQLMYDLKNRGRGF